MSGLARRLARRTHQPRPSVQPGPVPSGGKAHIAIVTPCDDHVATPYMTALVEMLMYTWNNCPPNLEGMSIHHYGSSILPFSRNALAAMAIEKGATHLLWIDSDMSFHPDTAITLLSRNLDIVGANCSARRPPFRNTARRGDNDIATTLESTGVEECDRIGFGLVLITSDVFRAIEMPWFDFEWLPEKFVFKGEDFYFFEKAAKAGYKIYADHDVSKGVQHVGTFGYTPVLKPIIEDMEREHPDSAAFHPPQAIEGAA